MVVFDLVLLAHQLGLVRLVAAVALVVEMVLVSLVLPLGVLRVEATPATVAVVRHDGSVITAGLSAFVCLLAWCGLSWINDGGEWGELGGVKSLIDFRYCK